MLYRVQRANVTTSAGMSAHTQLCRQVCLNDRYINAGSYARRLVSGMLAYSCVHELSDSDIDIASSPPPLSMAC